MKLQEFFNTQKHIWFTDIDKLDLYQSILYKKTRKSSLKRTSFVYTKYFVYSTIFVFLMLGTYGMYLFNGANVKDYNRFAVTSNSNNIVQADYIAQVIDFNGKFSIEHNGVIAQTNNIGNGDTILLKEGAQLIFEINSGTQSKIIGPAKLVIQKTTTDNYKLNLIYGNFIQMKWKDQKQQTIELAINDIIVKQQDKSQPMNFEFVKNGANQVIKNNGANIIITKNNGTDRSTTMSNKQVLTIQNNDIKLFANVDSFSKAIQDKNISQTFSITTTKEEINSWKTEDNSLLALLGTSQQIAIDTNNQEITKTISSVMTDNKKILTPEQDDTLSNTLYAEFTAPELKEISIAFSQWDDESFTITYSKIEKRIKLIATTLNIEYTNQSWDPIQKLTGTIKFLDILINKISGEYNIPPKYIDSLKTIQNQIANIFKQGHGTAPVQTWTTTLAGTWTSE